METKTPFRPSKSTLSFEQGCRLELLVSEFVRVKGSISNRTVSRSFNESIKQIYDLDLSRQFGEITSAVVDLSVLRSRLTELLKLLEIELRKAISDSKSEKRGSNV